MEKTQKLKAYGIILITMIILSFIAVGLSMGSLISYVKEKEISLAIFTALPVFLSIGASLAMYKMYNALKNEKDN